MVAAAKTAQLIEFRVTFHSHAAGVMSVDRITARVVIVVAGAPSHGIDLRKPAPALVVVTGAHLVEPGAIQVTAAPPPRVGRKRAIQRRGRGVVTVGIVGVRSSLCAGWVDQGDDRALTVVVRSRSPRPLVSSHR